MKPEKFINLLVFLVATGMLVWGICGNAGWKLLGANLLTAVFFMFLYRKDDNHPGVFSFAVRYAALALAFANARIMTGIAHGNLLLLFVLAAVYCLIDACLPVLAYQCGFRCSSKPVIPDRTIILFVLSTFLFAALDKP